MYNRSYLPSSGTKSYSEQEDDVVLKHLRYGTDSRHFAIHQIRCRYFTSSQTRLMYNFVKQRFSQTPCSLCHLCVFLQRDFLPLKLHFVILPAFFSHRSTFHSSLQNLTIFCHVLVEMG